MYIYLLLLFIHYYLFIANCTDILQYGGTAIGFMSLCTEVNLDLLNKCFDLGPLHGLKKPHPDDVTAVPPEPGN